MAHDGSAARYAGVIPECCRDRWYLSRTASAARSVAANPAKIARERRGRPEATARLWLKRSWTIRQVSGKDDQAMALAAIAWMM